MSAPLGDNVIARLKVDDRTQLLDKLAARYRNDLVAVEWSTGRTFDNANHVVGRILTLAYSPGTPGALALIVVPEDTGKRVTALSPAHILRVRKAVPYGKAKPDAWRLTDVIAGPPVKRGQA